MSPTSGAATATKQLTNFIQGRVKVFGARSFHFWDTPRYMHLYFAKWHHNWLGGDECGGHRRRNFSEMVWGTRVPSWVEEQLSSDSVEWFLVELSSFLCGALNWRRTATTGYGRRVFSAVKNRRRPVQCTAGNWTELKSSVQFSLVFRCELGLSGTINTHDNDYDVDELMMNEMRITTNELLQYA